MNKTTKNIFIVGSKGIPGRYGGFETFVDKLTEYHVDIKELRYHVACKGKRKNDDFIYNNARCFTIKVPNIGPAQAIYYDVMALKKCCSYIEENQIEAPIIYILTCRIGPFMNYFCKKIKKLGGVIFLNPDGHEWLRAKWSWPVRRYWKLSERVMVKHSDMVICDSKEIERYVLETYRKYSPVTSYISYGAETSKSTLREDGEEIQKWYKKNGVALNSYYLVVGRLVPENNYETIISEYMKSKSQRDLVLITDTSCNYFDKLKKKTNYDKDERIKFAGTMYDQKLLKKIRENAYGYIHGHEVGGTNPSLLEALASTKINLLLDVGFNREVGAGSALYWSKEENNLSNVIQLVDRMGEEHILNLGKRAKKRIEDVYNWQYIADKYKEVLA